MKANLYNMNGEKIKTVDLPIQFEEEIRPDLIQRAVRAIQSNKRQPYGAAERAGKRSSAKLSRRRRHYRGAYGHGISRVPRKILTRRGVNFYWVGAFVPGMVGGRRAHPPKPEKVWSQKINTKERRKAIRSALAAACSKELVEKHGHRFKDAPILIEDKFEALSKTKEVENVLTKLGLEQELERITNRKIRAGRGKSRGRKYKVKKGPLIIVSQKCALQQSAKNILGVEVAVVDSLNAELLAPGTEPGRLTIFTNKAIERMNKEKLFTGIKTEKPKKEAKK